MRKYFYEIVNTVSRQNGSPLTRIYITAKRMFSHREMFSKQEQLLDRITDTDCPLDGALQIALTRDLSVSALCFCKIDHFNKLEKEIEFAFVHSLEIVAFDSLDTDKFIAWLSTIWKGEWSQLKAVKVKE